MGSDTGDHPGIVLGVDDSPTSDSVAAWPARAASMRNVTLPVRDGRTSLLTRWVGLAAVVFSGLYIASDVIEAVQGGFSYPQLVLTFVAEAAIPFVVVGLYLVQRPEIGRLGFFGAAAYAYSYVFFTGTVVYAIVHSTVDYATLSRNLGAWMTIHGVVMVVSGLGFGIAVIRADVLPAWTGFTLMVGVLAVAASQTAPEGVQVVAAAIRATAFAGMGLALVLRRCARIQITVKTS